MYCSKCGAKNNPGARFCGTCGHDISATTQPKEEILETNEPEILDDNVQQEIKEEAMINNESMIVENNVNTTIEQQQPEIVQPQLQPINQPVQSPNIEPQQNQPQQPKSNKTVFIIIGAIIALIIIVAAVLGIIFLSTPSAEKQEKKKINNKYNPDNLIKVKSDNKYGYINTEGKFIINASYETATDFYGDYAVVRTEIKENGLTRSVYQIIDKKGNVKKQGNIDIEYIEELDLWIIDSELYSSSMKKLSAENVKVDYDEDGYFVWVDSVKKTGGIMNEKGKQTYTYQFQDGENYISIEVAEHDETQKETYCIINIENDKYSIVNCDTGVTVQEFTEHYISEQSDNIFKLKNHDTWDFVEIMYIQGDKKAYTSTSDEISLYYYPGYVSIYDYSKDYSDRYTYLHTETLEIKSEKPSTPSTGTETTTLDPWETYTKNKKFNCSTGYGLMNNEQVTLQCEWSDIEYIELDLYKYLQENKKEYVYGEKDNKWYLIDLTTKKPIVEFNAYYIYPKEGTTYMYYTDQETNNKKVYNLLSGKTLNVETSKTLTIYSNYLTIKDSKEKTLKYYNTEMKLIYTESL